MFLLQLNRVRENERLRVLNGWLMIKKCLSVLKVLLNLSFRSLNELRSICNQRRLTSFKLSIFSLRYLILTVLFTLVLNYYILPLIFNFRCRFSLEHQYTMQLVEVWVPGTLQRCVHTGQSLFDWNKILFLASNCYCWLRMDDNESVETVIFFYLHISSELHLCPQITCTFEWSLFLFDIISVKNAVGRTHVPSENAKTKCKPYIMVGSWMVFADTPSEKSVLRIELSIGRNNDCTKKKTYHWKLSKWNQQVPEKHSPRE